MYDDIQPPPQPLPNSKFKPWYWIIILPAYLVAILWGLSGSMTSWAFFFEPSNLSTLSLCLMVFSILMLIWLSFKLSKGFQKLAECSQYEVYLTDVFENRNRQRPTHNAMRLDHLRQLRKNNSEVRAVTEKSQTQLLRVVIMGLLILLAGSIGQLINQLMLP